MVEGLSKVGKGVVVLSEYSISILLNVLIYYTGLHMTICLIHYFTFECVIDLK